ncbi:Conserved_hypothetical protein [Hexamita inflata]|uniref:Transmembrane protein n=1 Tax=Hexamita inflata TaxID=28002 RepID=A0AA86NQ78_9EUKA|nr:Conserved hypothetical protein [Hexamita inflata]
MILLTDTVFTDSCIDYVDNEQSNPIITLQQLESVDFAYLAYKIYYAKLNYPNYYLKYIYTSVTAESPQINVPIYGQIWRICTSEADNIKLMNSVSQVTNISNFENTSVQHQHVTFIDQKYEFCTFSYIHLDNTYVDYIYIASNSHGQLLTLYEGKTRDWSKFKFDPLQCNQRTFINIQPKTGIIIANQRDVMYPVYNTNLSLYKQEYGNFLYPQIRVVNQTHQWLIQAPCNPLQKGDLIVLSESIMFGEHYEYLESNNLEQILVGAPYGERQDGFENISIINKCVQFYANSPRDIEYPLNSGIIFNIRTEVNKQQEEGFYQYFYSPYICVDNFTFMPAMFYTWEDPALKKIFTNLTNINNAFENSVADGSWGYLTNNDDENQKSILYTRSLIKSLQDICLKAYFSDEFIFNLCKYLNIILITLIGTNLLIQLINQYKKQQQNKKYMHLDYIFTGATLIIIMIVFISSSSVKLLFSIIFGVGFLFIIVRGLCYYVTYENEVEQIIEASNNTKVEQTKQQIRQKKITFWTQYIIQAILKVLDIIQTVTDIMQILQYLQIQYYSNRVNKLFYLIYPSEKILYAAEYLAKSTAYPIILLGFSLINQEIMKQEWFKNSIVPSSDPLDNKTFLIKMLLQVFGYFQGFVYNVFFAFTDTKLSFDFINNEVIKYNVQVVVKIYLSGTIYSISKFQLILEYYQQINKAIIKIFSHLVQILTDVILMLAAILKILKYICQLQSQALTVQIKLLLLSILQLIYYTLMLVLDPIVTIFLPTSLMFQELTKLCPFLLQVFGICDHQNEFAKQTSILLTTNYDQLLQRILSSLEVWGICIFFGLLFSKNQTISTDFLDQWQAILFGVVALITPYVCKNTLGSYIMQIQMNITHPVDTQVQNDNIEQKQIDSEILHENGVKQQNQESLPIEQKDILNSLPEVETKNIELEQESKQIESKTLSNSYRIQPFSLQYKTIELQNELTKAECEYHKSLLNVRGDYKHEAAYYEDFLVGFIFTGYGVIPGFGIILATVAKYMNNNGFASDGESITQKSSQEIKRQIQYLIEDILQIVFIFFGIYFALTIQDATIYFMLIFLYIVFFYYQLLDEQLIEAYGHNADYYTQCESKKKNTQSNDQLLKLNQTNVIYTAIAHTDDELLTNK